MSYTTEELREIYESVPREYVEILTQTVATGRFGSTVGDLFKWAENPFLLGEFVLAMHMKAEELNKGKDIVTWLSTKDGRMIDADKLDQLIYAFYYYAKHVHNKQD